MSAVVLLRDVDVIAVQAGFWASVAFPTVTATFWPWWKSWWGRNLVALDLAIALSLLSAVLQVEFDMEPGSTPGHVLLWISSVSLCLVPVVIVWRGVLTWVSQRRGMLAQQNGHAAD